ncbi:PilZ domain-containing protein [Parasphingorhabdus sp.]
MPQSLSTDDYQTSPSGNRRTVREIVEAEIFIRQSNSQLFRATLSDLSVAGFRMTSYTHLDRKKPVFIRLPGIQTLSADIKWVDHEEYGCEFANELHPAVLEHLVVRLREFG